MFYFLQAEKLFQKEDNSKEHSIQFVLFLDSGTIEEIHFPEYS